MRNYVAFFGNGDDFAPGYYVKNLLWFAWPSLPLILWMLWTRGRGFNGGLRDPGVQVPAVMSVVILATLVVLPDPKLAYAIPLLVPFALLAALEVDSLKRGFSGALDWFGILTFGLLAMMAWGFWIDAYVHGMSPQRRASCSGTRKRASARRSTWARCWPRSSSRCSGSCWCGRRDAPTGARSSTGPPASR